MEPENHILLHFNLAFLRRPRCMCKHTDEHTRMHMCGGGAEGGREEQRMRERDLIEDAGRRGSRHRRSSVLHWQLLLCLFVLKAKGELAVTGMGFGMLPPPHWYLPHLGCCSCITSIKWCKTCTSCGNSTGRPRQPRRKPPASELQCRYCWWRRPQVR